MRDNIRIMTAPRRRLRVKSRRVNALHLHRGEPGADGDVFRVPLVQLVIVVGDKVNILLAQYITAAFT